MTCSPYVESAFINFFMFPNDFRETQSFCASSKKTLKMPNPILRANSVLKIYWQGFVHKPELIG